MKTKLISTRLLVSILAALGFLALSGTRSQAQTLQLQAQLLWGTNDKTSPDPKHTPVDPDIEKKLKGLPLKWTHYFVVSRTNFQVAQLGSTKVALSEKCAIEVKNFGRSKVEVSHFGKGERVLTGTQVLPKGEALVIGGNAPSSTSWLLVLKRME